MGKIIGIISVVFIGIYILFFGFAPNWFKGPATTTTPAVVSTAVENVQNAVQGAVDAGTEAVTTVVNEATEAVQNAAEGAANAAETVVNEATEAVQNAAEGAAAAVEGAVEGATEGAAQ